MSGEMAKSLHSMRKELMIFPTTERFRELENEFWRKPEAVFRKVVPLWDLRRSSLRWNWKISSGDANGCQLVQDLGKFEIGRRMFKPEAYRFPGNWREIDRDKALLVIDYWLRGIPLTPPVLVPRKDGTWEKLDGFHRLVIGLMGMPHDVPLWFLNAEKLDERTPVDQQLIPSLAESDIKFDWEPTNSAILLDRTNRFPPVPSG
jgi:hypothetical protein